MVGGSRRGGGVGSQSWEDENSRPVYPQGIGRIPPRHLAVGKRDVKRPLLLFVAPLSIIRNVHPRGFLIPLEPKSKAIIRAFSQRLCHVEGTLHSSNYIPPCLKSLSYMTPLGCMAYGLASSPRSGQDRVRPLGDCKAAHAHSKAHGTSVAYHLGSRGSAGKPPSVFGVQYR